MEIGYLNGAPFHFISTPLSSGLRSFSWGVCSDFLFLCMYCLPLRFSLYMWFIATWIWCLGLRLCFYLLFQYLFCLGFSEPLNLWFDAFHCVWKFLSNIFIHICSTTFSFSSSRIPITYKLDNFIFFTDTEFSVLPPTLISYWVLVWVISIDWSWRSLILFLTKLSQLMSMEAFFISVTVLIIPRTSGYSFFFC